MKKHTKVYFDALGYDISDTFIPSELSGMKAVDLHHLVNREDRIENLMALTREEHIEHGEIKTSMKHLLINHKNFLDLNDVEYDNDWFDKYLKMYE
jgi:hypothetical protein